MEHSVKTGDFVLKSGARSSWFLDTKQTACRADGIIAVTDALVEVFGDDLATVDAMGGLTMGGDPVAYGVAAVLATRPVEGDDSRFSVRILFYRQVWKGDGQSGDHYIPPGQNRMEMIYDGQIYQQFFAKLSKGLFLEAHQI